MPAVEEAQAKNDPPKCKSDRKAADIQLATPVFSPILARAFFFSPAAGFLGCAVSVAMARQSLASVSGWRGQRWRRSERRRIVAIASALG
eukprot:4107127-Pyramimonas_sp.AAC.1